MTKVKFTRHFRASINEHFNRNLYLKDEVEEFPEKVAKSLQENGWVEIIQAPKPKTKYSYKPKPKRKYKKKVVKVEETKATTEDSQ